MLEMITDFWKPVKKQNAQDKVVPDDVKVGTSIGFGFVPQVSLSGQRLQVSAINTYQFGAEALTSFVLTQETATGVSPVASLIFAESNGEYYLALSRRIVADERDKLFEPSALRAVLEKNEVSRLPCRENVPEFKGWTVPLYKREIAGIKGRIFRGDYRKAVLPLVTEAQEFDYVLMVSDSNEQAIEIEKYADGRMEIYATVYRRISDIGEITHPDSQITPLDAAIAKSSPALVETVEKVNVLAPQMAGNKELPKPYPLTLPELKATPLEPAIIAPPAPPVQPQPVKQEFKVDSVPVGKPTGEAAPIPQFKPPSYPAKAVIKEETAMSLSETGVNGIKKTEGNVMAAETDLKPRLMNNLTPAEPRQEMRLAPAAPRPAMDSSDSLECDLRVANTIIDEAIRNEMRLTDVVRRIIELPVANQETVQIPMTLTDEDFALLAIRYDLPLTDRSAIKKRIIDDLEDFSGGAKKKVA